MTSEAQRAVVLAPEDEARADTYALIGRLLYAPPDEALRRHMLQHPVSDDATPLAHASRQLQEACSADSREDVQSEYDELFVGVGKSPVTLYTGGYVAPHSADRHLLALRNQLDAWGLARRSGSGETEDHISGICDVMRWLIGSGVQPGAQAAFFFEYVAPAVPPLCAAITSAPQARFYRSVAAFLEAFYEVERAAFELGGTEGLRPLSND